MPITQYATYRKMKSVDIEAMMEELSEIGSNPKNPNLSQCILSLENRLKTILNRHASLTTWKITARAKNPWFTEKIHESSVKEREYLQKIPNY